MNRASIIGSIAALVVAFGIVAAQTPPKPVPAKDAFPNGCVSCHAKLPDGHDVRLNMELKGIKKHPNVAGMMKTIPGDCAKCHGEGSPRPLANVVHKMHFAKGDKSAFVQKFGGSCLACHRFNATTNRMDVKSGPKNW